VVLKRLRTHGGSAGLDDKFTASNFITLGREVLGFQLRTLYPVQVQEEPRRLDLVFLNHDRNFSTFLTILYLAEHGRVADIYTLSRSMFESVVSMGLLAEAVILDDIERYKEFQYVEILRTYNHLRKLGMQNLSGLSASEVVLVSERSAGFVKKWGKRPLSWTGRSLEDNVKSVDEAYPPTCDESHFYEYLYCQVYREGSQSSHSSFAGLSKAVDVERVSIPGPLAAQRFKPNDAQLVFACFHSLLVFASSVRFLGQVTGREQCERYFQQMASHIISEE